MLQTITKVEMCKGCPSETQQQATNVETKMRTTRLSARGMGGSVKVEGHGRAGELGEPADPWWVWRPALREGGRRAERQGVGQDWAARLTPDRSTFRDPLPTAPT